MGLSTLTIACCTRNRPRDLERLVASVVEARALAKDLVLEFLVVDDGALEDDLCKTLAARLADVDIAWRYHNKRERAGLLESRVESVKLARHDWLMFVDDDVEIAADYLARLRDTAAAHPDLAGIGGIDLLSRQRSLWRHLFCMLFGFEPLRLGQLSYAGFPASIGRASGARHAFPSLRIYGSNMTFRRAALSGLRSLPGFRGYSIGEDGYCCFTALQSGGLRIEPALKIKHYHAPSARDGDFDVGRMSLLNYWHLMCLFGRPSWRLAGLLVSLPALTVMTGTRALLRGGVGTGTRSPQFARGRLSALLSIWRGALGASETGHPEPQPESRRD